MVREGYSTITVSDSTKERFNAARPPSITQDEFVTLLLDLDEEVEPQDGSGPRPIPEAQCEGLVDDVAARVERQFEQVLRKHSGRL